MFLFENFNCENKLFKPFAKGAVLLNNIITYYESKNKLFIIFSSSKCKTTKKCTLTVYLNETTDSDLAKLENLLKHYTWNLSSTLRTSENGISYTFKSLLNRYKINISYKISIVPYKPTSKIVVKKFLFNNLPKQLSFFD